MSSSDWDLGQRLIDLGACTIDQVREAMAARDRAAKRGAPPPLERVLLDRGLVTPAQLARAGVRVEAGAAPLPARRSRAFPLALAAAAAAVAALVALLAGLLPGDADPRSGGRRDPAGVAEGLPPELASIAELESAAPDLSNAAEVVKRYEEFIGRNVGKPGELAAHRAVEAYRARCEKEARPALVEIQRRDPELRKEGRFGELLSLYRGFPSRFLGTCAAGREAEAKIAELEGLLEGAFARDHAEVERLVNAGELGEATGRLAALEAGAPAGRRAGLAALRQRVTAKLREDIADRYSRHVVGPFREALSRRDARAAAQAVREFIYAPWKEHERPLARVKGVDYGTLSRALEEWRADAVAALCEMKEEDVVQPGLLLPSEAALLDLRNAALVALFLQDAAAALEAAAREGETLDVPGLGRGKFGKREGALSFTGDGGTTRQVDLGLLHEDALALLAGRSAAPARERELRAGFFFYYAAKGRHEKAYEHLLKAQQQGAKGVQAFLAAVGTDRDRELATKLGAAVDCVERRRWAAAKSLLDELLKSEEHPYTRANRARIDNLLYEAAKGLAEERELSEYFWGKVEHADAGTVRIRYDFEQPAQGRAFDPVTSEDKREFRGRWGVTEGAMESLPEASVMRWRPLIKGDVIVEVDLTPLEAPQNIALDLYYNRGRARHYAVILGFDWIGRSEGDREDTAEDRYGVPRTCVVKFPVEADRLLWTSDDEWKKWRDRLVGRGVGDWKAERGKTVRLRVARAGKSIAVQADGRPVWEGEDADYTEGHLLFYSDCRCRLDNLSITLKR
jgi:hypothetical protein